MNKIKKSFKNVSMLELTSSTLPKSMPKDNQKSLLEKYSKTSTSKEKMSSLQQKFGPVPIPKSIQKHLLAENI